MNICHRRHHHGCTLHLHRVEKFKTGRGTYTFYLQEVLIRVGETENQMKEIFNPHSLCHYKPNRRVSTSLTWPFLWDSSDVILPSFLKLHSNNSWGPSNEKDPNKMTNAWSPQPIKPPETLWRSFKRCVKKSVILLGKKTIFHYLNLFSHASLKKKTKGWKTKPFDW